MKNLNKNIRFAQDCLTSALNKGENHKASAECIEAAIFTLVELFASEHDKLSSNGTSKAIELLQDIIENDLKTL